MMAIYSTAQQLYLVMESLFDQVKERDFRAEEKVQEAKLLIRFNLIDPAASITINGRRNPAHFSFGDNRLRPEVDVHMDTDIFHKILLGEVRLTKSLAEGAMKIKGPVYKTLALADLFKECQDIYPTVLEEHGLIF